MPLLPGTGVLPHLEAAAAEAAAIGYPVLLKATAGGGGIGMARCDGPDELADAWARVTRAGAASFGSGALFIERFLPVARHVEVQVVGDGRGGVAVLGDRDCSVQRRNQKVLEEAPAPDLARRAAGGPARGGPGPGRARSTTGRWAPSSSWSTRRGASTTSSRSTPGSRSSTA